MAIEILMPALSPTMTEGNLTKWVKKEGDKVSPGDVLAEIETDKATMEVESIDEGVLAKILVTEGTSSVKVNQLLAVLLEDGDSEDDIQKILSANNSNKLESKLDNKNVSEIQGSVVMSNPLPQGKDEIGKKIFATPLAKRIASMKGIDLSRISGSGPRGRIIKADLDSVKSGEVGRSTVGSRLIPHSSMRKVIARRLCESKQTVPHFYLSMDCNITELLNSRSKINQSLENKGCKISVNDIVIKACAMALKKHPAANASWQEDGMLLYNDVDISVAVAIEDGLITPIVLNADQKDITSISQEMKSLASRAKAGQLQPSEFQGGGFSISNLGMYGVKQFNAIINPPQACILAVGAAEDKPVVQNGQIVSAKIMNITLSCDHRVVDGALAAELLSTIKNMLECPVLMFI